MENKSFKSQRRLDYKSPDFTALNVDLTFTLADTSTKVKSIVRYKRLTEDKKAPLVLDGEDLELKSVDINGSPCKYRLENSSLVISNVPDEFDLQIENIIDPAANSELMGLYKSNGTYCTQCEPQGFRRITFFLDRPDVLARYKVTIIGPEYGCGVLLSNGNLIDSGERNGRQYAVWEDPFPKPSYLFALVAGTFDIIKDSFKTKSGRNVSLELYVDRGAYDRGLWAMECIKNSMKWDENRFSLEYDLDNFKVVAVDFFNQGAMENKGLNIFNSIYVMVDPNTATDTAFYNVESVIGHEYFHNYTGDRVTLRDWFQLSLKESLTVFRDQEFSSDVASRTLTRLHAINVIRGPQFAEDASPMAHSVRPEEVVEMNNFYTVTIYDKGAEVIRMIHTLIGEIKFKKGLHDYLTIHDGKAVTIDDFIKCMEDAGGIDLTQFMRWYTQAGTPKVTAKWHYDDNEKALKLTLSQNTPATRGQSQKEPFYMPINLSFINAQGQSVHPSELSEKGFVILDKEEQEYTFTLDKDTLPVILRDFSAPVKLETDYTNEDYARLLKYCDDPFIKVNSAISLQNDYIHEKVEKANKVLLGNLIVEEFKNQLRKDFTDNLEINPQESSKSSLDYLVEVHKSLLTNINEKTDLNLLNESLKISPLVNMMETFDEINLDSINKARNSLESSTAVECLTLYQNVYASFKAPSSKYSVENMALRSLNNTALHMICVALVAKSQSNLASDLVLKHYDSARNMTNRLAALTEAVHLNLDCAPNLLSQFEKRYGSDPLVFDNFFRVQATAPNEETVFRVRKLLSHERYDETNPNRIRALPGALALSNPVALHRKDGAGYNLLLDVVSSLNESNPHVAARILTPLLSYKRFDSERQKLIIEGLKKLRALPKLSRSIYEKVSAALDS